MGVSNDIWKKDKRFSTFRVIHRDLKYFELFVVADLKQIIENALTRHDFSLVRQEEQINFFEVKRSSQKYNSPFSPKLLLYIFSSHSFPKGFTTCYMMNMKTKYLSDLLNTLTQAQRRVFNTSFGGGSWPSLLPPTHFTHTN